MISLMYIHTRLPLQMFQDFQTHNRSVIGILDMQAGHCSLVSHVYTSCCQSGLDLGSCNFVVGSL